MKGSLHKDSFMLTFFVNYEKIKKSD